MENIKTSINGIDYIKIDLLVNRLNSDKEQAKAEKYDCIQVGVKQVNDKYRFIIYTTLVPEKNLVAYNGDKMEQTNSASSSLRRMLLLFTGG